MAIRYEILGNEGEIHGSEDLIAALDELTEENIDQLVEGQAPFLWDIPVVYRLEPARVSGQPEEWWTLAQLARTLHGDCEDLACGLAASLEVSGTPARAWPIRVPAGWHIVTVTPHGAFDPSVAAGMPGDPYPDVGDPIAILEGRAVVADEEQDSSEVGALAELREMLDEAWAELPPEVGARFGRKIKRGLTKAWNRGIRPAGEALLDVTRDLVDSDEGQALLAHAAVVNPGAALGVEAARRAFGEAREGDAAIQAKIIRDKDEYTERETA